MKNVMLFAAIAALAFSTTSCTKDYECTYEIDILGVKSTQTATCAKCSKDDVQELEDAGWTCD
jgi:hypothetical protein